MPKWDGRGVYVAVFGNAPGPTAVLDVDLDGRILSRREAVVTDSEGIWRLAGQIGGEPILAQVDMFMDAEEISQRQMLHAVTGDGLQELTVIDPALLVRLAGVASATESGTAF